MPTVFYNSWKDFLFLQAMHTSKTKQLYNLKLSRIKINTFQKNKIPLFNIQKVFIGGMMKRTLSFVMVLLALVSFVFADVTVKDLGDGTAEVTFFYGNPRASEVVIAGDFTNWEGGALPMTLIEGKGWEYKTVVPHDTVMKYKFISDGNWTADLKAPDTIDDGFGGKNGLVEVAVLVAAASGNADAAAAASSGGAGKLRFQSWSMAGFQTKFQLKETVEGAEDNGVLATGLNVKSYLKVSGEALKNVPMYIEVALAEQDSFNNLYNRDSLALKDGLKNALVDTIFDPAYFYGGQEAAKTYLGHLKYGITTPYVEWTTGYKYAKMPPHASAIWNTITDNWDAGYNFYEVKQKIEEEGYVAIMLMNENSHFTNYGHFILATGVTEDGKFMINDPNSANYNRGNLQDGFENGFSDGMIQQGWSGCWLIEPKDAYMLRQLTGENDQSETEE